MSRSETGSPTWARIMMSAQRRDSGGRAAAGAGEGALRGAGAGRAFAAGGGGGGGGGFGALSGAASAFAGGRARHGVGQGTASSACAITAPNITALPSIPARARLIRGSARHRAAGPEGRQDGMRRGSGG